MQHLHDAVVGRLAPLDPADGAVAPDDGQLRAASRSHRKTCRALPSSRNFANTSRMASRTRSSGSRSMRPSSPQTRARRQREPERAAAGLAVPGGEAALPEEAELVLGHRPFQAEQQPVVHQARVVDAVRIDDQGAGQRAEVDQMVPVAPVARQPRGLEAEHRADGAGAELGDQTLEAGPGWRARSPSGRGRRRSP